MATKAELEAVVARHAAVLTQISNAEKQHDYPSVIRFAVDSLPLLRETLQYRRRYDKDREPNVPAIAGIFRYAPALFHDESISAVEAWIEHRNKPERDEFPTLAAELAEARQTMSEARRLWSTALQSLTPVAFPTSAVHAACVNIWINASAALRVAGQKFTLITHPDRLAEGRCSGCGSKDQALFAEMLQLRLCPKCKQPSSFVISHRII